MSPLPDVPVLCCTRSRCPSMQKGLGLSCTAPVGQRSSLGCIKRVMHNKRVTENQVGGSWHSSEKGISSARSYVVRGQFVPPGRASAAERLSILSAHSRISVAVAFSGSLLRPLALSLAAPAGHRHHCGYLSRRERHSAAMLHDMVMPDCCLCRCLPSPSSAG